jgi:hypothetical protein
MQQQFNEEIPVYANEMAKQGCSWSHSYYLILWIIVVYKCSEFASLHVGLETAPSLS